jgi:hypothetical protein
MIPAGLETNRIYNYYDDSEDDDFDEFDFGTQISKVNNEQLLENDSNRSNDNKNSVELNNNYYYDENLYVLDDLKNAILNKNINLVVGLLDKHNLDINVELSTKWIPIMYAVQSGSFELTKLLVDRGADLSFTDGTIDY